MKDSKEQALVQIPIESEKLEEISKRIQEQSENYISTIEPRIDRLEEKLKGICEDLILEYIAPGDITKLEKEMIDSPEVWEEFRKRVKEEIFLDILSNVIYVVMKDIDNKKLESITKEVLSNYNSSVVFKDIKEIFEETYEDVLSKYYTKSLEDFIMETIMESAKKGKKVKVQLLEEDTSEEELKGEKKKFLTYLKKNPEYFVGSFFNK